MQESIVCPFCPLHCDDLRWQDGRLDVQCDVAVKGLQNSAESSIDRGLDALRLPQQPIVQINNPTLEESKRLQVLVESSRIRLQAAESVTGNALSRSASRDGYVSATLGEIVSRANFVWVIGDTQSQCPRLLEKIKRSGALVRTDRTVTSDSLSQLVAYGSSPPEEGQLGNSIADQVATMASSFDYTAVVVGEEAFEPNAELVCAELLSRLVNTWNHPHSEDSLRRAVLLRFSESESLRSVFRWRCNAPAHAQSNTCTSLAPHILVGDKAQSNSPVNLQIGGRDAGSAKSAAYATAGSPGIHFPGSVIRGDGSVTLPLGQIIESEMPSRLDVLESLVP